MATLLAHGGHVSANHRVCGAHSERFDNQVQRVVTVVHYSVKERKRLEVEEDSANTLMKLKI